MKGSKIHKRIHSRLLSLFMALILCISSNYFVFAENLFENWSDKYIKTLAEQNIYENIVASYDAKRTITYTEFIEMAAKLFHYDKLSQIQSQTITLQNWFTENITDIATGKSNQTLTRQDAVVMLAKMLKYDLNHSEKSKFKDDDQISEYARSSVNVLAEKGHLKGYLDGTLKPENPISFGEAASLLCSVSGSVYSTEGVYDLNNQTIQGNISIVSPNVVLENAVVEGDLYISEGVGTGEVTLNNVVVKGETVVSGGGINSILFIDTQLGTLRVEVPDNVPVRVMASGSTNINMTEVRSESKLQTNSLTGDGFQGIVVAIPDNAKVSLEGNFPSVVVDSPKAKVDILGGKAENIVITEKAIEAKVNIASIATVSSMKINAQATIGGTGKLEAVSINAQNVSIAQNPDKIDIKEGISSNINNSILNTGTYTNHSGSNSSSNKGSSSSSGGNNPPSGGSSSPNKPENNKELFCSYKEISQTETNIFVDMFFDEPIEFLVNGNSLSDNDLNNLFTYKSENESGTIENAFLSGNKKCITFCIPRKEKSSTYQISLEEKDWTLRGIHSKKEFSSNVFLNFTISDFSNFPFKVKGPDDITVFAGEKAVFKANVETSVKLNYQWYRNDTEISGATEGTYSFITGLSDNNNKFSVKVWLNHPDNVREVIISKTAVLTVQSKADISTATVILEEGSEGIEGDKCITGLKLGYRYYIFVFKENKSYPIMKDGTLGSENTEILYENLEPLETTTISNLINEEKYLVVKVLPDTPILQSLSISGFTNTLNFYGYVPKSIDGEILLTNNQLKLKMDANNENSLITVFYQIGENGEEQFAYFYDDYYMIDLNYASDVRITITVSSEIETENKSVYKINATRAANILVTRAWYDTEDTDVVEVYDKSNIEYHIKYMKPTENFDGILCKKNNDDVIELKENEHYTKELLYDSVTSIKLTNTFTDTLVTDDELEFSFKFSGGTVSEKICKIKICTPAYNIKFGEPELISGNEWLNIFVPVTKGNGEVIDDSIKDIIPYICVHLYANNAYYADYGYGDVTLYEKEGQTGIVIGCWLSPSSDLMQSVPNQYKVEINYYKTSENTSSMDYYASEIYDIPEGEDVKGEVVFYKSDNPSDLLIPSKVSENKFTLNLTNENTPFYHHFQTEEDDVFSKYLEPGRTTIMNNNGQTVDFYTASETEPELVYMVASMNSMPKLFLYDYEGEAAIKGDFITNHYLSIFPYGDLGYNFIFNYTMRNQYFNTVKELKERYLNTEDIHLNIGTKKDGVPLEKTIKEFLEKGYFNGTSEETDITNLYFGNVKELFAAFNVNPLEDTINFEITSSAKLNGTASTFQLSDATVIWNENYGELNTIIIKDKNSENFIECNPNQGQITIPYAEAAIVTKSTGNYECVIFDEDALPIDSKGLILTPGVSVPIAIVVAKGGVIPKVYTLNITYEPENATEISTFSMFSEKANISFVQLTDDMSEEEIKHILKSLENQSNNVVKEDLISNEISNKLPNKPSNEVINQPSDEVTSEPSDEVTSKPSDEVTSKPSDEVTNEPSDEVTNEPSDEATNEPSDEVTSEPSDEATSEPSDEVTSEPSDEATSEPSDEVTNEPSDETTSKPSDEVTSEPSDETTSKPSDEVTSEPSNETTSKPSDEVTREPSDE